MAGRCPRCASLSLSLEEELLSELLLLLLELLLLELLLLEVPDSFLPSAASWSALG